MLLSFSVSNFKSFNEEVTLSMMPVKSRLLKNHILQDKTGRSVKALPIATIYGANASGKSNLIQAIGFMRKLIEIGTRYEEQTGTIPYRLDKTSEGQPSRFEMMFKHDGVVYTYGFLVSSSIIHEEWLFAYFSAQESKIFERVTREGRTFVEAGQKLINDVKKSGFIDFVAQGTRPNQLFLTEAAEKNVRLLEPVMHWFSDHLYVIKPGAEYLGLAFRAHRDKEFIETLSKIMSAADVGIQCVRCEEEPFDAEKLLKDYPNEFKALINRKVASIKKKDEYLQLNEGIIHLVSSENENASPALFLRLISEHIRGDGTPVLFDMEEESDGTQRLMHLAPLLRDCIGDDNIYLIDELDQSLHTLLARHLIAGFLANTVEKQMKSQLILTTHDTNLLDRDLLRRDEVLFMEKDALGASHLTSLAEFKMSEGLNYENGYLHGRFGAIPFLGDPQMLTR